MVDSAALVAQVLPEAQLPVPAQVQVVVGLAQLQVKSRLVAKVVLARLPVLVRVVLAAAVAEHLLSRQSFSAAMARSTP